MRCLAVGVLTWHHCLARVVHCCEATRPESLATVFCTCSRSIREARVGTTGSPPAPRGCDRMAAAPQSPPGSSPAAPAPAPTTMGRLRAQLVWGVAALRAAASIGTPALGRQCRWEGLLCR